MRSVSAARKRLARALEKLGKTGGAGCRCHLPVVSSVLVKADGSEVPGEPVGNQECCPIDGHEGLRVTVVNFEPLPESPRTQLCESHSSAPQLPTAGSCFLPAPSAVEPAPRAPRADVPEPQPIPPRAPAPVFGPSPTLSFFCPEESPAAFRTVELSPMVCPTPGCLHSPGMHVGGTVGGRCAEVGCRCDGYRPTSTASSHKEH